MSERWTADQGRGRVLKRRQWLRTVLDIALMGIIFLLGDLAAPGSAGHVVAFTAGLALGSLCVLVRADQVVHGALGTLAFFALLWVTRGSLSSMHMYMCMPLGCCCAYAGYRRQERALA